MQLWITFAKVNANAKTTVAKDTRITEKGVENSADSGIINTKIRNDTVVNPMSKEKYELMKSNLAKNGIVVMQATGDDLRYL